VWSAGVAIAPVSRDIAKRIATRSVSATAAETMYLIRTRYLLIERWKLRLVRE
jgi:hypothetical protein